ncbi:MAG: peptidoglycan-binding protein, partial [bacterium]
FQNYNGKPKHPADRWERFVHSPKSVQISPDGARVFVQMLEGGNTVIFDGKKLVRLKVISHRFGGKQAGLFNRAENRAYAGRFQSAGGPKAFNRYRGKPVEGTFSHGGRFLWVTHYRRGFDRNGVMPSSVAIIDTKTEAIVRVMHTGPIPKFLAVSPDGRLLAVVHWGDNTVGLIDVSSPRPEGFRHAGEIVVGRRLRLDYGQQVNRDRVCGFCLRGAVFTRDSRHLLVARMGGGGIAVLDVKAKRHVGTVFGMKPTPRHLVLAPQDERVYLSSNRAGYVSAYRIADLVSAAKRKKRKLRPLLEKRIGPSIRTIAISPDGETLYATSFQGSKVVALRTKSLEKLFEIPADSYPVGIAVSPDGGYVWVTSQGYRFRGGNSVMVYRVLNKN